jgi:hypothetical protein
MSTDTQPWTEEWLKDVEDQLNNARVMQQNCSATLGWMTGFALLSLPFLACSMLPDLLMLVWIGMTLWVGVFFAWGEVLGDAHMVRIHKNKAIEIFEIREQQIWDRRFPKEQKKEKPPTVCGTDLGPMDYRMIPDPNHPGYLIPVTGLHAEPTGLCPQTTTVHNGVCGGCGDIGPTGAHCRGCLYGIYGAHGLTCRCLGGVYIEDPVVGRS